MNYVPTQGKLPGRQWMPSNGTEGEAFQARWCCRCARDKVMNGEVHQDVADERDYCSILMASYTTNEGPVEWREIHVGPGSWDCRYECTGFINQGDPIPPPRDENTPDMFSEGT